MQKLCSLGFAVWPLGHLACTLHIKKVDNKDRVCPASGEIGFWILASFQCNHNRTYRTMSSACQSTFLLGGPAGRPESFDGEGLLKWMVTQNEDNTVRRIVSDTGPRSAGPHRSTFPKSHSVSPWRTRSAAPPLRFLELVIELSAAAQGLPWARGLTRRDRNCLSRASRQTIC